MGWFGPLHTDCCPTPTTHILRPPFLFHLPHRMPPHPPPTHAHTHARRAASSQAVAKVLGSKAAGGDWPAVQASLRSNLEHAPKLAALADLLLGAGIGCDPARRQDGASAAAAAAEAEEEEEAGATSRDAGHRVLVFAQLKGLLDLVEAAVLAPLRVSSLRIDGGVDAAERFRRCVCVCGW